MATEVVMPKMGYDMEEGTILRWLKKEGDEIAKGDILAEIETGKVTIEMEAFDAGILRAVIVAEGETVPVGTPVAIIGAADEEIEVPSKPPAESKPEAAANGRDPGDGDKAASTSKKADRGAAEKKAQSAADGRPAGREKKAGDKPGVEPADKPGDKAGDKPGVEPGDKPGGEPAEGAEQADGNGRLRASPLARRIAGEHDIDLAAIAPGSGPHGRVVRDDVQAAIDAPPAEKGVAPEGRETLSRLRQTIARRMTGSWQEAPHIFVTVAVEMDAAIALRAQINELAGDDGVGRISLNDMILKATARALADDPRMNVSYDDGERIVHGAPHVGVAVALDDGLITLTIPDAHTKTVSAIGAEVRDKAERARSGKLRPADMEVGSTFTVSNLGMYGVEEFTAILNPPEAGILAVGAAAPEAVVRNGEIVVRNMMRLTLSADHRVVDGATAAEFLVRLKQLLEQPGAALA